MGIDDRLGMHCYLYYATTLKTINTSLIRNINNFNDKTLLKWFSTQLGTDG